ncbi:ATP-binding protein [Planomonospora corallina]|uniref:histidine kinase n=1 Tax=Planomonospora corallina TaxID=1806052 RepID=A0ABV8IH24_9ACTN
MTAEDGVHDSRRTGSTGLLDLPEMPELDHLTRVTARLLDTPAALVSLTDHDRQVVVSAAGAAEPQARRRDPLPPALSEQVTAADGPLVVPDARADERLRADRSIGGLEAAACAAFPLHGSDGETLGALCAIDTRPRRWKRAQLEMARDLARTAEGEIRARQEAQRLWAIIDNACDAFVSVDGTGTVREWSTAAERLFGWSAAEAVGRRMSELIIPERLRRSHEEMLRAYGAGGPPARRTELTVADRTGREFPAEMTFQTVAGHGERALHAFLRDITDQCRVQTLTRAQHAAARVLADAASSEEAATGVVAAVTDALGWTCGEYWQVDADGTELIRVGSWARPGRDLSAFAGEGTAPLRQGRGLPGRVWAAGREIWIPDMRADPGGLARAQDALRAGLRGAIALPVRSGRTILGVLAFYSDDAQERDDELTALLDGVCAHVGRYMERRRAEELELALAASRHQFNQIVTHVNDDVWIAEITPEGRARPVYVSTAGAGVLGRQVPVEEDENRDMVAIVGRYVHPGDRREFTAFCDRLISGKPAEIECRLLGLDGVTRWVWIRALPRREGGRLFVDGISTDVTERHRMQEERERLLAEEQRQVQRLRELDRMKDELVALVSHELRNPIGAIRGYSEMLLDASDLDEEHRMFVGVIDRMSAHLQQLVDDLLDLARLDAGRIAIDPRPLSLTRLVRQAVDDHRPEAEAGKLTVEVDLARHLGVHADPVRLRQVLDNLLSNAIKYTPEGGSVTVTAHHDGGEVVIDVADTGIGIPAEQYPKLFTRFFRASTAQEAGTKGTGLGLAITRAIVDAHGGGITATPREGGGTVFTVRLPATPAAGA